MVHILKQTQRELELILTNPFVHVTYHSYNCLFQKNNQSIPTGTNGYIITTSHSSTMPTVISTSKIIVIYTSSLNQVTTILMNICKCITF